MTLRILLADDDDDQVILTRRALQASRHPFELAVVRDGTEVLERLRRGDPVDILLLDLHMPRMTGLAVLEALRADPRHRALPVVVMSASMAAGDEQEVHAAGATAFVPKISNLKRFSSSLCLIIDRIRSLAE